eukprot:1832925-Pyramimonas_sp.AAC.1
MRKFVEERLFPGKLLKGKAGTDSCTAGECSQARAVLGSLNWLTRELRADGSGRCSLLQQALSKLTYDDAREINQLVKRMKETAEMSITVWSIPFDELMWVSVSDASLRDSSEGGSLGAFTIIATSRGDADDQRRRA